MRKEELQEKLYFLIINQLGLSQDNSECFPNYHLKPNTTKLSELKKEREIESIKVLFYTYRNLKMNLKNHQ